jgi:hypothetical protein
MNVRTICFLILVAFSAIFVSGTADAQGQQHPYYLHALSDLRAARWMLQQHIDGKAMTHNEKEAMRQINEIIREINEASINDGKGTDDHPAADGQGDAVHLSQCIEFLNKAKDDFGQEADSRFANGLRDRSIRNCDEAIKFVHYLAGRGQ